MLPVGFSLDSGVSGCGLPRGGRGGRGPEWNHAAWQEPLSGSGRDEQGPPDARGGGG